MLLLAGVVFCFAGRGVACSALFPWNISKNSAYIVIVDAGIVKGICAAFHPVREQEECSSGPLGCSGRMRLHVALLRACAYRHTSGGRREIQ
jgi:hypothetical protein